jgi:DNA-binding XRE family transcriptional regulator
MIAAVQSQRGSSGHAAGLALIQLRETQNPARSMSVRRNSDFSGCTELREAQRFPPDPKGIMIIPARYPIKPQMARAWCGDFGHSQTLGNPDMVAPVVTHVPRRPPKAKRRLFLQEHRKEKGVSAATMAERMGIERESVYRIERESWRVNSDRQIAYAEALGIEPEDLWRPPSTPSLDAIVKSAPVEVQILAADIVRRLVGKKLD